MTRKASPSTRYHAIPRGIACSIGCCASRLRRRIGSCAPRATGVFDLRHPDAALRAVLKPYGARILRITPYFLLVEGS